jgi:NifU-like protein involved in Fe-S cluster formation/predicted Fe-Mo cluster-binding NifX family protein
MCPQNAHSMPDADAEGSFGDPSCGDYLTVYIKVKDNHIDDISYLVFGCSASIATSSMTSVMAKGKGLDEALRITEEDIIEALDGLPESKVHCSNLGVSALRNAINNYLVVKEWRILMKIAIPVDEKSVDSNVCVSFGRTPYFLIYDVDTKESVFLDNSAAASTGGAGIKAAQTIVDNKANVLLTPRCGENAAEVLKSADIEIFKTTSASVKDNIDAFIDGKLPLLDEIHAGFHGHGGN